jgi:hypothetical protein
MKIQNSIKPTGLRTAALGVAFLSLAAGTVQAAIVDLTPTSGTTATYSQFYDFNGGSPTGFDLSNTDITFDNIDVVANTSNGRYKVGGSGDTGSLTFDFDTDASADNLSLSSVEIDSHAFDFGNDTDNTIGEWSTDGGSNWTKFYDTQDDGNGILTDTISGTGITGKTALKIRYTTTAGNNKDNQQIFGVRDPDGSAPLGSWTHSVTAEFTAIPEPGTFALLAGFFGLGYVMVRRRS